MLKKKLQPHYGKSGIILTVISAILVAVDLVTKFLAKKFEWQKVIIPNFIEIDATVPNNPGCAFSFLNEHPEIGQPILITFTFVLLVLLVFGLLYLPERFVLLKTSVSIVIAGAIGNLVDRLMFRSVRDFFGLWMFGNMTYCNFADFLIVIGAIIAVLDLLFLNEWSVFPLTQKAKAAQAARKAEEERKHSENSEAESAVDDAAKNENARNENDENGNNETKE